VGSYTSPGGLTLYFVPAREASEPYTFNIVIMHFKSPIDTQSPQAVSLQVTLSPTIKIKVGSYTSPGGLTLYFVPAREASELGKDRAGGLIVGDKIQPVLE
jgi:hypothetical protein